MVGHTIIEPNGIWTKLMKVDEADLTKLCGHVFGGLNGKLRPYEYREGLLIDVKMADSAFSRRWSIYRGALLGEPFRVASLRRGIWRQC